MRLNSFLALACGLSFVAAVAAQPAQPPAQPGKAPPVATNSYPTSLYQMNDVSKSLNLTQDQITKLNKLTEQTQTQYRDDFAKLGTLNDADRFTRTQELNRKYYADWNKGARDIFNDTQQTRYQQFNYQYGGFNTLYDSDVQKRLNLTAEQQQNLRAQWDWSNQQLQEINRMGATDAAKGTQMYRDYWKARDERFNKFLTAEQQKAWNEMVGDPYTFQPTFTPNR
jgi:Spy/CpxP family protein refolding chaperone